MKFSEKGLGKLYNSKACYYDDETEDEVVALSYFEHVFEFEADDFEPEPKKEPTVELTIEEASEVWDLLINLVSYVESIDGGTSVLVRDGQRNIDLIRNRIKKAEGNND